MLIYLLYFLSALIAFFLFIMMISTVFLRVPFLPTHKKQARLVIELAQIGPGDQVIDLGSGAGRLLLLAAKTGAQAIGYELNPLLYIWTKFVAYVLGYKNIQVYFKSIYLADLNKADVVFTFLSPQHMRKLADKLNQELKPGAKILSYAFSLPGRQPTTKQEGIFIYR